MRNRDEDWDDDEDEDEEDDRPRRHPRGRFRRDWNRDDRDDRDRDECPDCGSASPPLLRSRVGVGGWVILGLGLGFTAFMIVLTPLLCVTLFAAPIGLLGLLGLLIREEEAVCRRCGYRTMV